MKYEIHCNSTVLIVSPNRTCLRPLFPLGDDALSMSLPISSAMFLSRASMVWCWASSAALPVRSTPSPSRIFSTSSEICGAREHQAELDTVRHSILNLRHSILNLSHSILNRSHSALKWIHFMLKLRHSILNPRCDILKLRHSILKLSHSIQKLTHFILKLRHSILNSRCDILKQRHSILS